MDFKNKVFIVTGGSSGIGKATAALLIEKGSNVVITGRNASKVATAAAEIGAKGIAADVSRPEGIAATINFTQAHFDELHGLINNAGHGWMKPMLEVTWEDFEETFRVNVFGAAMMAQAAAKIMVAQNYGNIVNIASTAATRGFPTGSVYSSSKFALRGMTQCWQGELRKHNIRVIGVNPSEVTTAFAKSDRIEREEQANKLRAQDIAHAIVGALAMDDRGYVPEITIHATNPF